jgi:superfamily II DNA or RNA helicase
MTGAQLGLLADAVRPGNLIPRSYQTECHSAIEREWLIHKSTLAVLPTGSGKTVIFSGAAKARGGALVLAHRDALIKQAAAKLETVTGERVAIEKAERHAFASAYICASVQTLKGKRLDRFADRFPEIHTIIVDECHRATSKGYRAIFAKWPEAKILGVTATADRSDGVGLKAVFASTAYRYELVDAIRDGWLAPLNMVPIKADVDLDAIKVKAGDLDQGQLDEAIVQQAGKIAASILESARDKRLIVFTPGVKTAHAVAAALNELEADCARSLDGSQDDQIKSETCDSHQRGEFRYLVNCALFLEGYDDPTLDGIFDAAPTKSRLRYAQKVGRATRPGIAIDQHVTAELRRSAIATGPKPYAWVFDLVCNTTKHKLAGPIDLLAGKAPDDVQKIARKILREDGGTVDAALDEAKKRITEAAAAKAAAAIARKTKVLVGKPRDIFASCGLEWIDRNANGITSHDPASTRELWMLKSKGIPIPERCTRAMFRRLMSVNYKRESKGLVNLHGVHWLKQHGFDAWKWTRLQGERVRQEIKAHQPGAKIQLDRIVQLLERQPGEDG